jgi:sugar transferase (PEP-CTERM system associated)
MIGRHLSPEMAFLCLLNLSLSFVLIYMALNLAVSVEGLAHVAGSLAAMLACTIAATGVAIGLYKPEICLQSRRLLATAALCGVLALPAALAISETFSVKLNQYYVTRMLEVLLAWSVCLLATRWIFGLVVRHRLFARPIVVIGSGERADRVAEVVRMHPARFFSLAGTIDPGTPALARNVLNAMRSGLRGSGLRGGLMRGRRGLRSVVVATDALEGVRAQELQLCEQNGVSVLGDVAFWEQHFGRIDLEHVTHEGLAPTNALPWERLQTALKRASDVFISLSLLLLTLPLMLLVALLIKIDSHGPVFYRQERIGLRKRRFTVLKFRSMTVDAEKAGKPRWALRCDPRITRVGSIIRMTRIDELPQLLNVLSGEMSFIGPRPERPHFVEQLEQVIPFYRERSCVKPGITGWAQVNYPYGASVEDAREKLSYDLYYVKNCGPFLDALILLSTVRVILFQEGAR